MKTYKEWDTQPGLMLDDYLEPCDEIDEELYHYMGEVVSPQYCTRNLLQSGEADKQEKGVYFYSSFMAREDGRYFYLGVLPKFKQPKY